MVIFSSLIRSVLSQVQSLTKLFQINSFMLGILSILGTLQGSGAAYGFIFSPFQQTFIFLTKPIIDSQNPPAPINLEVCVVTMYGPDSSPLDDVTLNKNAKTAKEAANKVFTTIKGKVVYPTITTTTGTYQVQRAGYFSLNYLGYPLEKIWPNLNPIKELKRTGCLENKKPSFPKITIYIANKELTGFPDSGTAVWLPNDNRNIILVADSDPTEFKKIIYHEMVHAIAGIADVYSATCIDKYLLVKRVQNSRTVLENHPASILGPVVLRPSFTEYQLDDITGIYAAWLRTLGVGMITYEQIADISPELAELAGIRLDPNAAGSYIRAKKNKIEDENFTDKTQDPPGCGIVDNGKQAPVSGGFKGEQDEETIALDGLDTHPGEIIQAPASGSRKRSGLD
jgi:hypothetical protein